MNPSPCRSCGRPIVWAKTEAGKAHPFDARTGLVLVGDSEFAQAGRISHFVTCPQSASWSGKNRETRKADETDVCCCGQPAFNHDTLGCYRNRR